MDNLLSFVLLGEGMLTGITLTFMVGPVTMIILRNGLEINRTAGIWVASGTWVSDLFFILLTFWMTASINVWAEDPAIKLSLYLVGGCGLLLMGLLMTRVKKKPVADNYHPSSLRYTRSFISGFLVNSLSPFTLFFWLGAAVFLHLQDEPPIYYYVGLMLTLATGDFTKAWIAPKLAVWLKEKYVYWIQVVAGITIAIAGGYIIYLGVVA
jgi:threonine/homoserine/homoserine lactone efflux protein